MQKFPLNSPKRAATSNIEIAAPHAVLLVLVTNITTKDRTST